MAFLQWFLGSAERKAAKAQIAARSSWQKTCLERARGCLTLAQHAEALAPPPARKQLPSLCETLALLRAACGWLLAWDSDGPQTWAELLAGAGGAAQNEAAGLSSDFAVVGEILERDLLRDATLPPGRVREDCAVLRAWAEQRRASCEAPERRLHQLRGMLWTRAALFALGLPTIAGAAYAVWPVDLDLAAGRPWKTSSSLSTCDPVRGLCAGGRTTVLFHTEEQESPWMDIDLGDSKLVRRVEVTNRSDCCRDRAVPLVVELSDDDKTWTEAARKEERFWRWTATFPARRARFVRLRVARKSILHLEAVAVR